MAVVGRLLDSSVDRLAVVAAHTFALVAFVVHIVEDYSQRQFCHANNDNNQLSPLLAMFLFLLQLEQ